MAVYPVSVAVFPTPTWVFHLEPDRSGHSALVAAVLTATSRTWAIHQEVGGDTTFGIGANGHGGGLRYRFKRVGSEIGLDNSCGRRFEEGSDIDDAGPDNSPGG